MIAWQPLTRRARARRLISGLLVDLAELGSMLLAAIALAGGLLAAHFLLTGVR